MKTILMIEDDQTTRTRLALVLEKAGYRVVQDEDGSHALALLKSERPDLILTDIHLPEKNGLEIVTEIRDLHDPVPIIAMSGGDRFGHSYLDISEMLGANAIMNKPFSVDELLIQIEACLK
ncbi:MAG: response regulator [Gammaproteobacteria bacterium SHHR-1]|uniref:response regulator transcription factor n=1 Tax=Magnetovirga frankeli TaxID=947516 RepID=UPI0012933321|nr:response regulator [gamma proteobacterium SS-5]